MRSDYGLYIVAVICFIIAGIFLTGAMPGYTFAESMGMVSIAVFLILGIIFAVTGYATKPKITARPLTEPISTLAEPIPPPMSPPPEEAMAEPVEPVVQSTAVETAPQETQAVVEEPAPVFPPEPPLESVAEPAKTEEVAAPAEKPVRRRRRKKTE